MRVKPARYVVLALPLLLALGCADTPTQPAAETEGSDAVGSANSLTSATVFLSDATGGEIVVLDSRTRRLMRRIPVNRPGPSAATPDGRHVFVTDGTTILVLNGRTGRLEKSIEAPWHGGTRAVAVHPDGESVYVGSSTLPFLAVIDVETLTVEERVFFPYRYVSDIAFSASGDRAYLSAQLVDDVIILDTSDHSVAGVIDLGTYAADPDRGHNPRDLVMSPDGTRLYVANEASGSVGVIDLETETLVETVNGISSPYRTRNLDISRDGEDLYVVDFETGVRVVDTETLTVRETVEALGGAAFGVAVTPDQRQVYVTNYGVGITIIDREEHSIAEELLVAGATSVTIVPRRPTVERQNR